MEPMGIVGNQNRLVTPLEEVPTTMMTVVEAGGVGSINPMESGRQVGIRGTEKEMVVIIHEAKSVKNEVKTIGSIEEEFDKFFLVITIKKNFLLVIAPTNDMVDGIRELDSPWPSHICIIA